MDKKFPESGRLWNLCTQIILFSLKIRKSSAESGRVGNSAELYEEINIFKLHIFGVEITTCSFPHIGKSSLRIKEGIGLIVKPSNMVNSLNIIYCNNGNRYFSPLRCHRIINTWSISINWVSKLMWFNPLLHAVFTFEHWLIVLIYTTGV